jgi:hypothetical protein
MTDLLRMKRGAGINLRVASFAAFGCVLGVTLLASGAPARAADDGTPIDSRIFRGVLETLGLRKDSQSINYGERAPLVIPPNNALPPPEKSDNAIARDPAWPKDPDVMRQRQEAEQARSKTSGDPNMELLKEMGRLGPNDLAPGPKPREVRQSDSSRATSSDSGERLSPSALGSKGNFFTRMFAKDKPDVTSFTGEPPRTALTDPPPGYQTPSPEQPYGVGKKLELSKPQNYLETHGTVSGSTN